MEQTKKNFEQVMCALRSLANGAKTVDVVEEFVADENGLSVLKSKKISTKQLAPDLAAIKLVLTLGEESNLSNLSDEELEDEKNKLLKLFDGLNKTTKM